MRIAPLLLTFLTFLPWARSAGAEAPLSKTAPSLVRFDSPESVARIERSKHKTDFFRLVNQFEPQENGGFCGPASAVIVLNALRIEDPNIEKPKDTSSIPPEVVKALPPNFDPFLRRYTQGTFFDERFERGKPKAVFFGRPPGEGQRPDPGLQIGQLAKVLEAHGLAVELHVVSDEARDDVLKKALVANLKTPGDYVLVNYHREALGQKGGGHISPLGAYDQKSDSFLILDVNATTQPWVWAPAKALLAAMRTKDREQNRGFVLVREGPRS